VSFAPDAHIARVFAARIVDPTALYSVRVREDVEEPGHDGLGSSTAFRVLSDEGLDGGDEALWRKNDLITLERVSR
jgi:hypothetical protein